MYNELTLLKRFKCFRKLFSKLLDFKIYSKKILTLKINK